MNFYEASTEVEGRAALVAPVVVIVVAVIEEAVEEEEEKGNFSLPLSLLQCMCVFLGFSSSPCLSLMGSVHNEWVSTEHFPSLSLSLSLSFSLTMPHFCWSCYQKQRQRHGQMTVSHQGRKCNK